MKPPVAPTSGSGKRETGGEEGGEEGREEGREEERRRGGRRGGEEGGGRREDRPVVLSDAVISQTECVMTAGRRWE